MSVGSICVRNVDVAEHTEAVWEAAERMHQRAVGSLVILNDAKEPIGIITDRDLVERVLAQRLDPTTTLVGQVMTPDPMTVSEEASINGALSMMRRGRFRRLPVVDDEGRLTGMLSLDDVLMLFAEEFTDIGRLLMRETPRGIAEETRA